MEKIKKYDDYCKNITSTAIFLGIHIQIHFYTKKKLNEVLIKKYRKNYDDSYTHEKKE